MINILNNKELRGYLGAGIIFFLVMGLLLFLAFVEIPDKNNDIFKVIVGMLVGSLSVVVYTFIGKNPEEVANLTAKNESLEKQVNLMVEDKDKVEKLLRDLQTEVIEKLAITGESFAFKKDCDIEECER
tara:strand:- start:1346 stop:1732 length:387 start_codon:yes stop_codon:yes gene_type:complete